MKLAAMIVLLTVTAVGVSWGLQGQKREVTSDCAKTVLVHSAFPKGPFELLPNETYKRSPLVKYKIQEDGTVSDVAVARTSGGVDIDRKVRAAVARWKFNPRPSGCGVIESEMSVTIDWAHE
jgi:TonB family protein